MTQGNDTSLVLRVLRGINTFLTFLVAFGAVLAGALLVLGLVAGFEEIDGTLGAVLAIAVLVVGVGAGWIIARWQRSLMASKGMTGHVSLLVVLLLLFTLLGPMPMVYTF